MRSEDELRHLHEGPSPGEKFEGLAIFELLAYCQSNADAVLNRCKEVLEVVLRHERNEWPSLDDWRTLLPMWFVMECADEVSREESERWLKWWQGLSREQQAKVEREARWSLSDWLYWFEPDVRQWFWWDAHIEDSKTLSVYVEVQSLPFPWGALDWLLRASGAVSVKQKK
ncbi:MAG TPA: hypothetical protein VJ464_01955 [Blastocatellia bacterium]|nr:hypothetical protein [Blastocatellia bacterium]